MAEIQKTLEERLDELSHIEVKVLVFDLHMALEDLFTSFSDIRKYTINAEELSEEDHLHILNSLVDKGFASRNITETETEFYLHLDVRDYINQNLVGIEITRLHPDYKNRIRDLATTRDGPSKDAEEADAKDELFLGRGPFEL